MEQPVTTNPLIIMCINMTIVFAVLFGQSLVIRLIHAVDPTREKKPGASPVKETAPTPVSVAVPAVQSGIDPEIVAVIAAALTAYGYSGAQIRSVRPLPQNGWRQAARFERRN